MAANPASLVGAAVADLLAKMVEVVEPLSKVQRVQHTYLGSGVSAALSKLYDALPDTVQLQDADELLQFVLPRIADLVAAGKGARAVDAMGQLLLSMLIQPRPLAFSIPLATHSGLDLDIPLGGARSLRLTQAPRDRSPEFELTLTGCVDCMTHEAGADEAERAQEELIGALLALRLANISRQRNDKPSLATQLTVAEQTFAMSGLSSELASSLALGVVGGLSDLERHAVEQGDVQRALDRKLSAVTRLFESEADDAAACRSACRFLARAGVTREYGATTNYAFMALETVLLGRRSKESVQARLIEAIIHASETKPCERDALQKFIKDVYEDRSRYVHSGTVRPRKGARDRVFNLSARALEREMALLEPASSKFS